MTVLLLILGTIILSGQTAQDVPLSIDSDWTYQHVIYPHSNNPSAMAKTQSAPRYVQNWYLHHPEVWWPQQKRGGEIHRDWNIPLDGGVGNQSMASKFNFDVAAAPNCTSGYVVTGISIAGSTPQVASSQFLIAATRRWRSQACYSESLRRVRGRRA
ncbi:MAG: hypothetical protein ABSG25_08865 [Bryobacteraceae bacterium]